ncbi:hypothetical protein [Micromonospora sp. ATA51]|uniref:hypothetical protein n=1 Tax=Micromonospora sp. ATA51 TaxID=2806098 RepID=UPI001A4F1E72|nr:hypothetical protein [Micromonospora sp. ATA51]MBM0230343.1 hypothetical protein [Micromonospora sp. ATA51]
MAPQRPATPSNRLLGVLVAAGLALLLGLVGMLALNGGSENPPAADRTTAAPVEESTAESSSPPEPATSAPSSDPTTQPAPVTLRQLEAAFADVLAEAEARGQVDPKTAEDLREKAAELDRGKPKDRAKRIADLRERVAEAVDDERIDADTAARLEELLTAYAQLRGGRGNEG